MAFPAFGARYTPFPTANRFIRNGSYPYNNLGVNYTLSPVQPVQPTSVFNQEVPEPISSGSNVPSVPTPEVSAIKSAWIDRTGNPVNYYDRAATKGLNFRHIDPNINAIQKKGFMGFNTIDYQRDATFSKLLEEDSNYNQFFQAQSPANQQLIKDTFIKDGRLIGSGLNATDAQHQLNGFAAAQQNAAWTPKDILSGVQTGISALSSLYGMYSQYKNYKLAKEQLRENSAMQRAQYKIQAQNMNSAYRDRASGRGFAVMSQAQKRNLVNYANRNRVEESY